MRLPSVLTSALLLVAPVAYAQSSTMSASSSASDTSSTTTRTSGVNTGTFTFASSLSISTVSDGTVSVPTGPYNSYSEPITFTSSMSASNASRNATMSTSSNTLLLSGTGAPTTATATSTSATPTNTQACNNYPELCNREYMNFTEVAAHNAAFVQPNNAASNQEFGILSQLNDGVRMIQGETHWYNESIYACHTSCDLLNAGTLQSQLTIVREWIQANPYEVVTLLLVNSDYRNVTDYVGPIQNSGLGPYLYEPPMVPMHRGDWPTLGNMILSGKRVVIFMDYQANQTQVPYVLDEFSQMWETPYSPTNISFPCTQQRPPGLNSHQQEIVPYLANHNLNVQLSFAGLSLLIPNFDDLSQVNSISGVNGNSTGALGTMADDCLKEWNRPPAWLLVDFYNYGNFNGSVFEVAANMNGLNYTGRASCCGQNDSLNAASSTRPVNLVGTLALFAVVAFWLA